YNIQRSLRFRSSASAYLSRTPASASNQTTWTWSGWVKFGLTGVNAFFGAGSTGNGNTGLHFFKQSNDTIRLEQSVWGSSTAYYFDTTQVFRDYSAWYHFVLAFDSTQATSTNRIKFYVNGNLVTAYTNYQAPTQNLNGIVNSTVLHNIGRAQGQSGYDYFDGYLAEINFIDGQALTPSSFGSTNATTGVWQSLPYTGTYGANGFYLPFTDNSALTSGSNVGLGKGDWARTSQATETTGTRTTSRSPAGLPTTP
ncbi:MAG: hypothetical protein EBS53_12320, partial [Bacteroidetes bacterium]|nr:hypothetical protein [Bacteroidota bacterium]